MIDMVSFARDLIECDAALDFIHRRLNRHHNRLISVSFGNLSVILSKKSEAVCVIDDNI